MKPQSISEQLMYNTIRIATEHGVGTGSFFNFNVGDTVVPVIITNQHVVNYNTNEIVSFYVHIQNNGEPTRNISIKLKTQWFFHSEYDLCFCYAAPLLAKLRDEIHVNPFFIANDYSLIPSQEQLEQLTAIEELTMVGYPIGLYDEINNLPIFRKGYTACHPSIDFNRKGIGLIDMACFPGSSGSPIYVLNEGLVKSKNGALSAGNRVMLLGYLFAGPTYSAEGKIVIKEIPTNTDVDIKTTIMANLGYYIKATALDEFKERVEKQCGIAEE